MNLYEAYLLCEEFINKKHLKRILQTNINSPKMFIKTIAYSGYCKNDDKTDLNILGFNTNDYSSELFFNEFSELGVSIDSSKSEDYYKQLWADTLLATNINKYQNNVNVLKYQKGKLAKNDVLKNGHIN